MTIGSNSSGHFFDTTLNADGALYSDSSGVISSTTVGTAAQVLTSNGPGLAPTFQNTSVPSTVVETLTGNSGGAVSPTANNITTAGTGSITVAGNPGTSTLTTQLTGLTNHSLLVGAGTATITNVGPTATVGQVLQSAGAAADPAFSTATYPLTTTINQVLYSSSANVVSGLATANRGVLTTGTTGVPVITALATDGQLIIGSTAGAPAAATLTAGTGISITNASNSITVAVNGGVVGETITGDTGGALSPTAGNWNLLGSGSITTSGSGSTLTTQLTSLTNHNVLVGAGTSTITKVAPSATSGVPLISNGAAADPSFGTAVVAGGGTGATTFNTNGAVISGTSSTAALAAVSLSNQQFLVGNTSAAPTAKTLSVVNQVFTSTGTYTPTSGMVYCQIICLGAGGGSGGCGAAGGGQTCQSGGGGAGEYAVGVFSASTIGASKSVTIGAAGTAGSSGTNTGGTGGTTSVGSTLISSIGGSGGAGGVAGAACNTLGGVGGTGGTGGDYRTPGMGGGTGFGIGTTGPQVSAIGGSSQLGSGGFPVSGTAVAGLGHGAGGGGGTTNSGAIAGAAGSAGLVVVQEFILS